MSYFLNRARKVIEPNLDSQLLEGLIDELQAQANFLEHVLLAKGYVSLLIMINRLVLLAKEKCSEIEMAGLDDFELIKLQAELQAYERETVQQKAELEIWKYQAEMMHEVNLDEKNIKYMKAQYTKDLEQLSDIESNIDYSNDDSSVTGSSITSAAPLNFEGAYPVKSSSENAEAEKLKVKFYSTAVNLKLGLPPAHPGKDIAISDLYEKAKTQKLLEGDWVSFLKKEFGIN